MDGGGILVGLFGAVGSVAFFAFLSFAVWLDYRKKKDERDALHAQRMKALEMGHPPLDAELERIEAYASAAWAAGLIGLLVPCTLGAVVCIVTIFALNSGFRDAPFFLQGLIVGWSIAGFVMLVTIVRSLSTIRQLPYPSEAVPHRASLPEKQPDSAAGAFQQKRLEL